MAGDIASGLRQFVATRAGGRCEYCLLHQDDAFTPHQVDHIISRKHGGVSSEDNLALACVRCNAWKGSDIAGFGAQPDSIARLYHPRQDDWNNHFRMDDDHFIALTDSGAATIRLLRLNLPGRVAERRTLRGVGRFPR